MQYVIQGELASTPCMYMPGINIGSVTCRQCKHYRGGESKVSSTTGGEFWKMDCAIELVDAPKVAWEKLDDNTWRTSVPGGWLVRWEALYQAQDSERINGWTQFPQFHMIYFPDPDHEWLKENADPPPPTIDEVVRYGFTRIVGEK